MTIAEAGSQGTVRVRTVALDRNELPAPPHPEIVRAACRMVGQPQNYPSWDAAELRTALADRYGIDPEWVIAAPGSIAVIQQAMSVAGPGELILPWPSFDAFPAVASARGLRLARSPIRSDGAADLDAVLSLLTSETSMILVCSPNSPTGGALSHRELCALLDQVPERVLVLLDQAYAEFADQPDPPRPVELAARHPRVIITRTFSKAYGLAGLRVGYGIARPTLASAIAGAGLPYAVTSAAEAAAIQALRQPERLRVTVARVRAERARLAGALRELGARVIAGQGNFVWAPIAGDVSATVARLAAAHVLVKGYPGHGVRISVGTSADTDALLRAWLAHQPPTW